MAGKILGPEIGLGLGDDEGLRFAADAPQQHFANEIARDLVRRPVEESRCKNSALARGVG
jgi:hypothetical protein